MASITGSALIARTRELMEAPFDRDLVGLNVDTGLCYGFNETAAAIWHRLAEATTFDALLSSLSAEFETTPDNCRDDVMRLVESLRDEGLVTVSTAP